MRGIVRNSVWLLVVLALPRLVVGQIGFAENQADRVRVWNADYWELAFRKADGRLIYIYDKTTGQEVSPGNIHGPWVLRFSDNTWLDGENFSPSNSSRKFTYSWNVSTATLTLDYLATGSQACHVVIEVHATEGPEVDTKLMILNSSGNTVELLAYPVQLSFRRNQIDAVYVPYIEGMKLLPNFFSSYEFINGYPGQMFADFAYTDLSVGSFAVYMLHDAGEPLQASDWLILRDDGYVGGANKYHHDYSLAVANGTTWESPTTVISVGSSLSEAMAAYWTRSGHDAMPKLVDKLGAVLFDKLAHAVLIKRDLLQGSWTFASFQSFLSNLPANNLIHLVAFWPNGFDENYPDYLPPHASLGSLSDLQNLVSAARASGHLVMPYTNPTWWDDQSPTLGSLGTGIVARDRSGGLIYENYGSHGGYVISPFDASANARRDQTRDEFTLTVPCDLMFEDQIGARGVTYDGHPSAPDPMQYTQGLIDVAARSAMWLPIMTESGFDRLAWVESGYCNSHTIGWHWWPSNTYRSFPMSPLWAHENLYFNVHNLAGTSMTNDLPALTYHVSIGYSLSHDLSALDLGWLFVLDRYQKHLIAPLVGVAMTGFEELSPTGRTRTTFGDGTEITANLTGSTMAQDDHVVVANGFIAERGGDVLGGVFSTLYGQALSGSSPHYILLERGANEVLIHQPRGDDGTIAIDRPAAWTNDARIRAAAVTEGGASIDQPVTIQPGKLLVNYQANVSSQAVHHFRLSYCGPGDAGYTATDFAACVDGPGVAVIGECVCADLDADQDVDLDDFADYQNSVVDLP